MSMRRVIGAELDGGIWRSRFDPVQDSDDVLDLDLDLYPDHLVTEVDFHGDGQREVTVHRTAERPGFGWIDAAQLPGNPYQL